MLGPLLYGRHATALEECCLIEESGSPIDDQAWPSRAPLRTGRPVRAATVGVQLGEQPPRWLQWSADLALPHEDLSPIVVSVLTDVTERKRYADELVQLQRQEVAAQLARRLAHEISNVITPLGLYPELISARLTAGHEVQRLCQGMQIAVHHLQAQNENLLGLASHGQLDREAIDVAELIDEARQTVSESLPTAVDCEVDLRLASDLLPIYGARSQLRLGLMHVLRNAVEAMGRRRWLRIVAGNVYLELPVGRYADVRRGQYVRIDIQDQGQGIPPAIRERVFDPYFSTKGGSPGHGLGLGLTILSSVVHEHGGYVDLHSRTGRGTTVSIYLPTNHATLKGTLPAGVVGGSESILIVERDESRRDTLKHLLGRLGYWVTLLEDVDQASSIFVITSPTS